MRKEWIRTEEEKELRQLQKLAKEQRRLNRLADAQQQQPHLNLPIVVRRKKRLLVKPTGQELVPQSVNILDTMSFITRLSRFRCTWKHCLLFIVISRMRIE